MFTSKIRIDAVVLSGYGLRKALWQEKSAFFQPQMYRAFPFTHKRWKASMELYHWLRFVKKFSYLGLRLTVFLYGFERLELD